MRCGEAGGARATDAGSNGRLSRSEPGRGGIADQAGGGAAGASGARMWGGSLETERRSCRATSIVATPSAFAALQRTPTSQRLPQRLPCRGFGRLLQGGQEGSFQACRRNRLSRADRGAPVG